MLWPHWFERVFDLVYNSPIDRSPSIGARWCWCCCYWLLLLLLTAAVDVVVVVGAVPVGEKCGLACGTVRSLGDMVVVGRINNKRWPVTRNSLNNAYHIAPHTKQPPPNTPEHRSRRTSAANPVHYRPAPESVQRKGNRNESKKYGENNKTIVQFHKPVHFYYLKCHA